LLYLEGMGLSRTALFFFDLLVGDLENVARVDDVGVRPGVAKRIIQAAIINRLPVREAELVGDAGQAVSLLNGVTLGIPLS